MQWRALFGFERRSMRIVAFKAVVAGLILATAGGAAADPEKGMAALAKGDYKAAIAELDGDVKKGDPDAMFLLSALYAEGKGVPADQKRAFQLMERAAKLGSVRAQGSLSMYFSEGIGTTPDDAKSLDWGRRAADAGDLRSQFIMGMRYRNGVGVPRDPTQVVNWWSKSAERGFVRSQVMLGGFLAQLAAAPEVKPEIASEYRIEAAKWLIVSDSSRLPGAEKALEGVREKMSAEEIASAESRARDWRPTGGEK